MKYDSVRSRFQHRQREHLIPEHIYLPQTASAMGVIEFLFCILRLATTRHFSNSSSIGGGGIVSGESGSGSSKIRMAGR